MKKFYWVSGHTTDGALYADSVKASDKEEAIEIFEKRYSKLEFEDFSVVEEHV